MQQYAVIDYTQQKRPDNVTDIQLSFTEEQVNRLSITEKDGYWIIKPKQFLGSEMFAAVGYTVRGLGGEYISAGRDSHFRVKRS